MTFPRKIYCFFPTVVDTKTTTRITSILNRADIHPYYAFIPDPCTASQMPPFYIQDPSIMSRGSLLNPNSIEAYYICIMIKAIIGGGISVYVDSAEHPLLMLDDLFTESQAE